MAIQNRPRFCALKIRPMKKRKYAIIDVETTGGMATRDKIIEIAIIVTDGTTILSEYQSLVHPERSIPYHITGITGIDNVMVRDAPRFYEIAKIILEHTEDCIFVAHNVRFDYNFIKEEYKSLGYKFKRKRLCTVKLTRSAIPGLHSYGLDNLIDHYGITLKNRHRAYDDTYATYLIFRDILSQMKDTHHVDMLINEGIDASVLPKGMDLEQVHDAPEAPGVYYMSSATDNVLYVGKAKDIKARIFQHFRKMTTKSNAIYGMIHKVHYQETGNELMALLIELYEIKRLKPELNKALRRSQYPYAIYHNPRAAQDKPRLLVLRNNKKHDLLYDKLKLFNSKHSAHTALQMGIIKHHICKRHTNDRHNRYDCHCQGNCTEILNASKERQGRLILELKDEWDHDFVIMLEGRTHVEKGFIMIHEHQFRGLGYIDLQDTIVSHEQWNDHIEYQFWYPETAWIIKNYMTKHNCEVIRL